MVKQDLIIKLRSICMDDAVVLMELNNSKEVADFVVGNPQKVNLEQQLKWMTNIEHETATRRWMIEYEEQPVGTIILSSVDHINAVANMNIKLLPMYQGKGIARNALCQACDIAFDELHLFCLTANILSYNMRSIALFRKVGFHEDGILRSRVIKNGMRHDLIHIFV